MLLYFKVKNYRSFRDEAILDMEAAQLSDHTDSLLSYGKNKFLPAAAIFGKNGGGKSNLIRAMWLGVQFICNAQKMQTENAPVPVRPFGLNDYSNADPTSFEFAYVLNGIKYVYGFSATQQCIVAEYLKSWPNGREKSIFTRNHQNFVFPKDGERRRKEMIREAVAPNQLFFAMSCTMNYKPCIEAMRWFRECVAFSRDYTDLNKNLLEYSEDATMLSAIVSTARAADVGIQDIQFEIDHQVLDENLPANMQNVVKALRAFAEALRLSGNESEMQLSTGKLKSTTYHVGTNADGKQQYYPLTLSDESDGTRRLMTLSPAIERTLANGGVLIVDELDRELHPMLVTYVLSRYMERENNPHGAQIIFTTHDLSLLDQDFLRRDQIYFVDKSREDGASALYSLVEFNVRNDANVLKAYLIGKFGAIPEIEEVH